jgi:hypothetical protein
VAERPENVGDLGGGLTLFEQPFDGRAKRETTQSARSFLGSISRVSARKNPPKKYESGGGMWETFAMYLVYIFISTEGYGGVKGAAKPCSHPPK